MSDARKIIGVTVGTPLNPQKISGNVESVNGKTGEVKLTAADVGALPADTKIPSVDGLATEKYVDDAIANIDIPETDLSGYATEEFVNNAIGAIEDNVTYPIVETTALALELSPNTYYKWGEVAALILTLGAEENGIVNEFCGEFVSGATATVFSVPASVVWVNVLSIEANKKYQFSIVNGIGVIVGV